MTRAQIADIMDEIATQLDCEYAYHHFEEGQNPVLPFLVFEYPTDNNFLADNSTYIGTSELNIYFCSDYADFGKEEEIKSILNAYDIPFTCSRDYIKKEYMYQTTFMTEVLFNG